MSRTILVLFFLMIGFTLFVMSEIRDGATGLL